jgi:hypothetical protein
MSKTPKTYFVIVTDADDDAKAQTYADLKFKSVKAAKGAFYAMMEPFGICGENSMLPGEGLPFTALLFQNGDRWEHDVFEVQIARCPQESDGWIAI